MNKLEKAILKNSSKFHEGSLNKAYQSSASDSKEIENMAHTFSLSKESLLKKKIIYPSMKDKKLVNSFRELRTALISEHDRNVIMVTSVCEKSGTSLFSRNIAVATAFDVSRTGVLIDCNFESDDVSEIFDLTGKKGLVDYLFDPDLDVSDVVHECGIKRLRAIPLGGSTEEAGEYFSHPRFKDMINQLKTRFNDRYIYIDAPPILKSADARILMQACDQVVVIGPYGKINNAKIEMAAKIIGKEKFSGVVFNRFTI